MILQWTISRKPKIIYLNNLVGSSETIREAPYCKATIKLRKSKDEDIVQPLLKDNGYYKNILINVI